MRTEIDMGAKKVHLYAKDLSSPVRRKRNVQIVLYVTPVESMVHHSQVKNERNKSVNMQLAAIWPHTQKGTVKFFPQT